VLIRRGEASGGANRLRSRIAAASTAPASATSAHSSATTHRLSRSLSLSERWREWREGASDKWGGFELATDLGRDIGSPRWLRGVATLVGLSAIALAGWPGFSPVEAAPAMSVDAEVRDEFRNHMIAPLALGADSGHAAAATAAVVPLASAPERPRLDLVATIGKGASFESMLRRAGVSEGEAALVSGMVASAVSMDEIKPGTDVDITLGRRLAEGQPRPLDQLAFRARFDLELAVRREGGRLVLDPQPIKVDTTPLRVRATVGDSLYRTARAAGAPPSAVQQYLRVMGREVDMNREIGANDEFDLIVDYKRAETGEIEVGDLLYAGIVRNGRVTKSMMRWGNEGKYFDASGSGEQREGLVAPVPGRITSRYGMRRHPILGYRRMHSGMDFRATSGTPIMAASDGRVEFAGRNGGYGNFVRLRHGGGLGTGYAHMSRIAVRAGQSVRRGQVIGYVGSTGLSTGAHLHYEMYQGSKKIDPSSVRFVTRETLSGQDLANFREQLFALHKIKPGDALKTIEPEHKLDEEPVREIDRLDNRQRVD